LIRQAGKIPLSGLVPPLPICYIGAVAALSRGQYAVLQRSWRNW
jgi:hypothetical protein